MLVREYETEGSRKFHRNGACETALGVTRFPATQPPAVRALHVEREVANPGGFFVAHMIKTAVLVDLGFFLAQYGRQRHQPGHRLVAKEEPTKKLLSGAIRAEEPGEYDVAYEIVNGRRNALLEPYGLERFVR